MGNSFFPIMFFLKSFSCVLGWATLALFSENMSTFHRNNYCDKSHGSKNRVFNRENHPITSRKDKWWGWKDSPS